MAISPINGGDLSETKQPYIYGVACAVYVLSFIAVALRFVARRLTLASRGWDDWLILGSLFLNTALLVHILVLLRYGFGRHLESMSQYAPIMKLYMFGDIAYTMTMTCTKLSILAFYWRIFGHTKVLRWLAGILCGLSAIWGVQTIIVSIFVCTPIRYDWDLSIPNGHCIDLYAFFISTLVINFVNDMAILTLPIPFVWRLNQSRPQRILVCGMFLLGGFVCITSVVRLDILINTTFGSIDSGWNSADFTLWSNVEGSIAIVSACLPFFRPLFGHISQRSKRSLSYERQSEALKSPITISHPISKEAHSVDDIEMSIALRTDETGVQCDHAHNYV